MPSRIRRITQCGHCGQSFTYHYDLSKLPEGQSEYSLSCPFCATRQTVSLVAAHRVDRLRDGGQLETTGWEIPEHPVGQPQHDPDKE